MVAPEADLHRDAAGGVDDQHHLQPPQIHDSSGGDFALQSRSSLPPGNEKEDGITTKGDQEKGSHSEDPAADVPERPRKSFSRFYRKYKVFFHIAYFLFFTG